MGVKTLEFIRRWSLFTPEFTYRVVDLLKNQTIGEVARNANDKHTWWASNKTWTGGGDLARTFKTRYDAAQALRFIADGRDPEEVGGYAKDPETKEETR